MLCACLCDLVNREPLVHRAKPVPQDDSGVQQVVGGVAAESGSPGSPPPTFGGDTPPLCGGGAHGFHIGICSGGTPIALAVLRPRCWSGKNSTRCPRSNAHSSTVRAFDEVQTMPPCSPTNDLRAAEEFMYVTGMTGTRPESSGISSGP